MNKCMGLVFLVLIVSCKSKALLAVAGATKKVTAEKIIEGHYANNSDFSTLYIKSTAHYEDSKQSQNVTAEIKIKKDEVILISIRFLGITMAKALITPTAVKYYEKLNGKYFEGNYAALSQWLGTDLDFRKLQSILIGAAFEDLKKGKYTTTIEDNWYKLQNTGDPKTLKSYFFEADNFRIKKQQIVQSESQRALLVSYPNYANYNAIALPTGLVIEASQKKGNTNINIDYNTVSLNEELSFPYSVPEGYERIFIN
ncbi:MAG: DUF4292 domain-containing protein [Burkholderiales bacterium]|nr:DUF4292 domain-containing protein [Flavobacterium sp.]